RGGARRGRLPLVLPVPGLPPLGQGGGVRGGPRPAERPGLSRAGLPAGAGVNFCLYAAFFLLSPITSIPCSFPLTLRTRRNRGQGRQAGDPAAQGPVQRGWGTTSRGANPGPRGNRRSGVLAELAADVAAGEVAVAPDPPYRAIRVPHDRVAAPD